MNITMSSLDTSDYVHVSKDSSLQLSNSSGSVPTDFSNVSRTSESTSIAAPIESPNKDRESLVVRALVMEDSIGCAPKDLLEGTDQTFNGSSSSGQESFAVIDQGQKSEENSPKTPKVNPLLSQVIGNIGSKLVFQSDSLGTLTKEGQNKNPSAPINESSESDIFKMSTTESNDSIIVLDKGDIQSFEQGSMGRENQDGSHLNNKDGESSGSKNNSLVLGKEIASQSNRETEKEHSLRLESFNGFESLLNTREERAKHPENMDLKSPGVDAQTLEPQPSGHGENLLNKTDNGNFGQLSSQITDELKSFVVPRNSLEWWPEEMRDSKIKPSPFSSYQMLPDDVGTSLDIDCSISMDVQSSDLSKNASENHSMQRQSLVGVKDVEEDLKSKADHIQEDLKLKPDQTSALVDTSMKMQSFPDSRVSDEREGNQLANGEICTDTVEKIEKVLMDHGSSNEKELKEIPPMKEQEEFEFLSQISGCSGSHLEKMEASSGSPFEESVTVNQSLELSAKLQIKQEEINNDSDLFGTGSDGSEEAPDRWSFLVRKEEEKYENTKTTITHTLNNYITAHGPISLEDVEDVAKMLTDVLINQNSLRPHMEESQKMDAQFQPFTGQDENQNGGKLDFVPLNSGMVGVSDDLQWPQANQSTSQADQEGINVENSPLDADRNDVALGEEEEEENYDEVMQFGLEQCQSIPVTNTQLRLFSMLNGKSVLQRKYSVIIREEVEDKKVVLKGKIENVNLAIKSISGNNWLGEFSVRTTKVQPVIMELLSHDSVMRFLDQELHKGLGFQFCWLPVGEKNYLIGYSDSEQNVERGLAALLKLVELRCLPRPKDETNFEQKMNALKQNNDGRIVWSILEDLVYIAWCRNLNADVNKCLQSMEVKVKHKETEKFVEIEADKFVYLKKWKMTEIEKIASSHSVGIEDGPGSTSGFIVMGTQGNIQAAVGPIFDLMNQISSRRITIKPEAAEVFRMNDFALIKYLERTQHCLVKVEDSGVCCHRKSQTSQKNSGDEQSCAFRVKDQVDIHIFSGESSTAEVDMLVETADRLEKTPYGKDIFHCYLPKLLQVNSGKTIFNHLESL